MLRISRQLVCDPDARRILRILREHGHTAYLVGGCVRDQLLGRLPKDWDIATSASPDEVEQLFPHTLGVGKAFGVMLVIEGKRPFEVATFRGESAYSDGRHPDRVHFCDPEEDARRRDFTINALFYDPEEECVLDFVGGVADIGASLLRTVGAPDERFAEDHLRLLRAVRFAARTGFVLEAGTAAAIRRLAVQATGVAVERQAEELSRMLSEGSACAAFGLLEETGLLEHVLPEIAVFRGVEQPPQFHPEGDVWRHTLLMLEHLDGTIRRSLGVAGEAPFVQDGLLCFPARADRLTLAWATLLHDLGKPATIAYEDRIRFNNHDRVGARLATRLLRRLRQSNHLVESVHEIVARHMRFPVLPEMREAKRRRFLQEPLFPLHLELHRLDCLGSHGQLDVYEYALPAWEEELRRPPVVRPPLSGHDLMALGYPAGPRLGKMLDALRDAALEGEASTPEEARAWVLRNFPPAAGKK
jgi:poly(A) polymerase